MALLLPCLLGEIILLVHALLENKDTHMLSRGLKKRKKNRQEHASRFRYECAFVA